MLSLLQREKARLRGFKQKLIGIGITVEVHGVTKSRITQAPYELLALYLQLFREKIEIGNFPIRQHSQQGRIQRCFYGVDNLAPA
jgi:hypothetical protein